MTYFLTFLVALVGFPLGFAASCLKRSRHQTLALAIAVLLPVAGIVATLIGTGIWELAAIPIATFYALIVLSPPLLLWMALTAFGYRFARRRSAKVA